MSNKLEVFGQCPRCGGLFTSDHKCPDMLRLTDEDLNVYLRPELRSFVINMEDEMRANDHKGKDGWKHNSLDHLLNHLMDEVRELHAAMTKARTRTEQARYTEDVVSEAADVANVAMMVADVARRNTNG